MDKWKAIPGFPGYEAHPLGAIRYADTKRCLNMWLNDSGYPMVWVAGKNKRVHKLVMLTFRGPTPEGMEIDHADRNRANPALSNLRWKTHHGNMQNSSNAKLTKRDVQRIRKMLAEGYKPREVAGMFNVTRRNVAYIGSGKAWRE